jgi:hypothetical protein
MVIIFTKAYIKRLKDKREPNSNYEEEIKDSHNLLCFCINPISIRVQYLSMTFSDTLDSKHRQYFLTICCKSCKILTNKLVSRISDLKKVFRI